MRGCGVSWGIMPTLGGLTVWAWQVLTVPGSSERNTLGWGMVCQQGLALIVLGVERRKPPLFITH